MYVVGCFVIGVRVNSFIPVYSFFFNPATGISILRKAINALPDNVTPLPTHAPLHCSKLETVVTNLPKVHVMLDAGIADAMMMPVPSPKKGELWYT